MFEIFEGVLNKYNGLDKIVIIPDTIHSIGDFAFYNCESIEEVIIPDTVTSIGAHAFYECFNLKKINFPSSINFIGGCAFSWCKSLENVILPDSIKTISKSTFYRCEKLKSIHIPDTIASIDHSAFGFCKSLQTINLPTHLTYLGDTTFEQCHNLTSITLPDTVTSIGKKAFFNCISLKEIQLSKNLKEVGEAAFQTYGPLTFISNDTLLLKPKMFDEYYNFNVKSKNEGNYQLHHSYMPLIHIEEWKSFAQPILLANFLEAFSMYQGISKETYIEKCKAYKTILVDYLMKEKRYVPLNQALDENIISSSDIEPYFDQVTDREQKAKLLDYKNKQNQTSSILDDLESELFSMF